MKKIFITLCLASAFFPAFAQIEKDKDIDPDLLFLPKKNLAMSIKTSLKCLWKARILILHCSIVWQQMDS